MTPALEPVDIFGRAKNLLDLERLHRRNHMQVVAYLFATCYREIPAEAIMAFSDTGTGLKLEAFELAIEYEVHDTTQRIGTVSRGRTSCDDIYRTHECRRQGIDVDGTTLVGRYYTRTIEQHERSLCAKAAHIQVAAPRRSMEAAGVTLRRVRAEKLR